MIHTGGNNIKGIKNPTENYKEIYIEFKWADADQQTKFLTMEDFYLYGDVAPLGRLNWIYQNYIPEQGNN